MDTTAENLMIQMLERQTVALEKIARELYLMGMNK
jgi:hypothetical protein